MNVELICWLEMHIQTIIIAHRFKVKPAVLPRKKGKMLIQKESCTVTLIYMRKRSQGLGGLLKINTFDTMKKIAFIPFCIGYIFLWFHSVFSRIAVFLFLGFLICSCRFSGFFCVPLLSQNLAQQFWVAEWFIEDRSAEMWLNFSKAEGMT